MPISELEKLYLEAQNKKAGQPLDTSRYSHLSDRQLELLYPGAFAERMAVKGEEVGEEAPDTNALLDFAGNLAWGFASGASMGATEFLDPKYKETLGVDEWEDESWLGISGRAIGEGTGFLAGLAPIGWGIRGIGATARIGNKALQVAGGKKIATEASESLAKLLGNQKDKVATELSQTLYKHGSKALKKPAKKFKKQSVDDVFDLQTSANKTFDDLFDATIKESKVIGADIKTNLLSARNASTRNEIRNSAMNAAREYRPGDAAKVVRLKLAQYGLGDKASQVAGNMVYESLLLGLHGGAGTLLRDWTADKMDISNKFHERKKYAGDIMHGALMGLGFGLIRYTPGGASTAIHPLKGLRGGTMLEGGILANVKQIGQAVARKWRKSDVTWNEAAGTIEGKYTPLQLQTILRNVYYGSGRNKDIFTHSPGWTERLLDDPGLIVGGNKANIKALYDAFRHISKNITTKLIPALTKEIGRDFIQSSPRMTLGSIFMNAESWIHNRENMSPERVVHDFAIGAFYMKRGKAFEGQVKPKFLGKMIGVDKVRGDEIAQWSRSLKMLGIDTGSLDRMGASYKDIYVNNLIPTNIIKIGNEQHSDLRAISKTFSKDLVSTSELANMKEGTDLKHWQELIGQDTSRLMVQVEQLKKQGKYKEANALSEKINDTLRNKDLVNMIFDRMGFESLDKAVKPMETVEEAYDFLDRASNVQVGGQKLNLGNVDQYMRDVRRAATNETTAQLGADLIGYIKSGLSSFGLWNAAQETEGTIRVHRSVKDLLMKRLMNNKDLPEYNIAAQTFHDVLESANSKGLIRFSDTGIAWDASPSKKIDQSKIDAFNDNYKAATERMHDMLFNTARGGWREHVPDKMDNNRFLDDSILSQPAIWHGIEMHLRHVRNDVGKQILTGKGLHAQPELAELNTEIANTLFKGKAKIHIKGVEEDTADLSGKEHIIKLVKNLNEAWSITGAEQSFGSEPVELKKLESIHEKLTKHVGNIFTDNNNFKAFHNYLSTEHINEILGTQATYGAKKALASLLGDNHPFSLKDPLTGKKLIASFKAIEQVILGSDFAQSLSKEEIGRIRDITQRYYQDIQSKIDGKGGLIEFSDKLNIDEGRGHTAEGWYQTLLGLESIIESGKIQDLSRVAENISKIYDLSYNFSDGAQFDKLAQLLAERFKAEDAVKELTLSLEGLRNTSKQLGFVFTDAIQNQDFILANHLVASQFDIARALDRAKHYTVSGKGDLQEVTDTIYKVTMDAISERNRKLGLDDIQSVEEFIEQQSGLTNRTDNSGRPVTERQTISEPQFVSKYKLEQSSVDLIKGDILANLDKTSELAGFVQLFIGNEPQLRSNEASFSVTRNLLENLEVAGISPATYVDGIIKPWADIQWDVIAGKKRTGSSDFKNITKTEFTSDLQQILVSAWAQKKMLLANYEDGVLRLSVKAVSDWNAGFLALQESLGLGARPNAMMLLGQTTIGGGQQKTKLDYADIQTIRSSLLGIGAAIDISKGDLLTAAQADQLKTLLKSMPLAGHGQDGRPQWGLFQLDEKQSILVSVDTYKSIVDRWQNKDGALYQKFVKIVGEEPANRYLEGRLKLSEFNREAVSRKPIETDTIEGLLLVTRLMNDNAYYLDLIVDNQMTNEQLFKAMKYVKLANPRGGMVLTDKVIGLANTFIDRLMPEGPQYENIKRHFNQNIFRPQKQVTLYDEKDPSGLGDAYFSSDRLYRQVLKRQLEREQGMTPSQAEAVANAAAELVKPEAKAITDGEIYLSLPEMAAILTARGSWGRPDMFIFNDANEIIGFNAVIKPVVSQNKVNMETGEISVVVDKTAYKYDPGMDAAMKDRNGRYWTDSIAFKSATKETRYRANETADWTEMAIPITRSASNVSANVSWKQTVQRDLNYQYEQKVDKEHMKIVNIDRSSMMIKSINGPHSGTVSQAYGNWLSNDAAGVLGEWMHSRRTTSDFTSAMNDLWVNPFAYRYHAKRLSKLEAEDGNMLSNLTGIDAVLNQGGIPLFDYQRPQIERALVSHFLGGRNFVSGEVRSGAYSTMTAGDLLSHPMRAEGMQTRFGGSGVPFFEADKSIRGLLTHGGMESISLVFRITKDQAANLNKQFRKLQKVHEQDLFQIGDEIIVSGQGEIMSPHLGRLKRIYSGAEFNNEMAITADNAAIDVLKNSLGEHYKEIIKNASEATYLEPGVEGFPEPKVTSLGDLVRWIDGNSLHFDQKPESSGAHDVDYYVKNGKGSMAEKYGYNAIRVTDVNLRTPKDGLNNWVITGIEKILDRRKGPVSEMNATDAINPQDADFDLDKSASFFGTPSKILGEIYNTTGYHQLSEEVLDQSLRELKYTNDEISMWVDDIRENERKRPALIRQHSIASLLYQYFTAAPGEVKYETLIKPGEAAGMLEGRFAKVRKSSRFIKHNASIGTFKSNNVTYKIYFRQGHEFITSVGHMKKMIKKTIDVYHKNLARGDGMNMMDHFWFADEVGMFKILPLDKQTNQPQVGESMSWNRGGEPGIAEAKAALLNNFVRPVNKLFNLQLGYERMDTGVQRNLNFYDYIKTFSDTKFQIAKLKEYEIGKVRGFSDFSTEFLKFLGEGASGASRSKHALIDGLIQIKKAYDSKFPTRFRREDTMANILSSASIDMGIESKRINDAITEYVKSGRSWAAFSAVQWELNQVENILHDLTLRRQGESSSALKYKARKKNLQEIISNISTRANDKIVNNMKVATKFGKKFANAPYAVHTVINGKVTNTEHYREGETVIWNKGQVVEKNPRKYVFSDPIQQKHLRTMFRAFGVVLDGVDHFSVRDQQGFIREQARRFEEEIRDKRLNYSDHNAKNSAYFKDLSTSYGDILATYFGEIRSNRGEQYAKQFLYHLLTPRVSDREVTMLNYDSKHEAYFKGFRYLSNMNNEKMVMNFLTTAMNGKAPILERGRAEDIFKEMEDYRKISYLLTHDRSLDGQAFKLGNMNVQDVKPTFNVIPRTKYRPGLIDVHAHNEKARNIVQQYLTGSYFLDPFELYRLTVGMDKSTNEGMGFNTVSERVRELWTDTGENVPRHTIRKDMGDIVYRISRGSFESKMKSHIDHSKSHSASERILKELCR